MKYFLFTIFIVATFSPYAHASDVVKVSLLDKIYLPESDIVINLTLNKCSQELKIRPTSDMGDVLIFNPKTLTWLHQNSTWEKFPLIDSKMKIRVTNVLNKKITLLFEVQNTRLGETIKSMEYKLWISDAYKNYVDLINENIVLQTSESSDAKLNR